MIDREKVISQVEEEVRLGKHWDESDRTIDMELLENVLLLLKEQEPKKIIRKQMSYEDPDGTITYYAEWHCPHCNKVVKKGFDSPWLKYCFNCGKPILWD